MKSTINCRQDSGHILGSRKAATRSTTNSLLGAIGLASALLSPVALAKPIEHALTLSRVDWTSGGVCGVGSVGTGTIPIAGVSGTVTKAFLYWHGIDQTEAGAIGADGIYDNEEVTINGNAVTGVGIGDATTNCWGEGSSRAHRADVTAFVTGNGNYSIAGLASKAGHNCNGASLVVVFDDGDATNNRDLVFFEGNDSNFIEGFPGEDAGWHASLANINYQGGPVAAQLHVADGQIEPDEDLTFTTINGNTTVLDSALLYDGVTLPDQGNGRQDLSLYDIQDIDITTAFGAVTGAVTLNMDGLENAGDCLGLIVMLLDLEPGSITPPNTPPDVSKACPSIACLWPPNHQFVPITIGCVTDAEGDPITINVLSITSDESTSSVRGAGGRVHSPDAAGVGTSTASLRAERTGTNRSTENGRVYEITFSASDGKDSSIGKVRVNVPHDQRDKSCFALDNGQLYDATVNN